MFTVKRVALLAAALPLEQVSALRVDRKTQQKKVSLVLTKYVAASTKEDKKTSHAQVPKEPLPVAPSTVPGPAPKEEPSEKEETPMKVVAEVPGVADPPTVPSTVADPLAPTDSDTDAQVQAKIAKIRAENAEVEKKVKEAEAPVEGDHDSEDESSKKTEAPPGIVEGEQTEGGVANKPGNETATTSTEDEGAEVVKVSDARPCEDYSVLSWIFPETWLSGLTGCEDIKTEEEVAASKKEDAASKKEDAESAEKEVDAGTEKESKKTTEVAVDEKSAKKEAKSEGVSEAAAPNTVPVKEAAGAIKVEEPAKEDKAAPVDEKKGAAPAAAEEAATTTPAPAAAEKDTPVPAPVATPIEAKTA